MTLSSLLKALDGWLQELSVLAETPSRIAALEERLAQLETGRNGSPLAEYTHVARTWPTRKATALTPFPQQGQKEYKSDEVDLKIALAVLRHDPESWYEARKQIASRRRLTIQQVAELKARITRRRLLDAA